MPPSQDFFDILHRSGEAEITDYPAEVETSKGYGISNELIKFRYIRTSSRFNRVEIPLQECKSSSNLEETKGKTRTFFDIFKNPPLMIHLLLNAYILIIMNGTYWALSLFSTELSEDKMTGFFLSGIVEIPAGVAAIGLLVTLFRPENSLISLAHSTSSFYALCTLPTR
ncbi:hypothetical protein OESDEN_08199 [Oesophagostomum dentatum]|uniref:Uncharacterized protein n=1 Tax=Oesophagostomum dentatum TaxID=61180 RepID=A0A0B1T7Y4_OESDE|nr:hypothetical protein OESDEN_08199 [Oesophagostomum dentatum]